MGEEIRCTATVTVRGEDYDALVRDARAKAVAFVGTERTYYLSLDNVQPEIEFTDGAGASTQHVGSWVGTARITTPHEPAF